MTGTDAPGLTRMLVERTLAIRYPALPGDLRTLAHQCLLDWLAVTLAGAETPLVGHLHADAIAQGGAPQAALIGRAGRLPVYAAALVNGAASHALDFDDVNYAMSGHPSVPVLPAVLALAEQRGMEGEAVLGAFVAGYEFECRVGQLVAPGHYAQGFHATATIGALGAALACAHLLGASAEVAAHAVGIAATQAAGLKSMFGTDCKPLHAGHAARVGAQAACLAVRGLRSRPDVLECAQGFAAVLGPDFEPARALADPAGGFHLRANLFKYHASCFETHATIESCLTLRSSITDPSQVRAATIRVNPYCATMCDIPVPRTGMEAKFSLRQMSAFALAGVDTAAPDTFSAAALERPEIVALRDRIQVAFDPAILPSHAHVTVESAVGTLSATHDASRPLTDLAQQASRLRHKATGLLAGTWGPRRLEQLFERVAAVDQFGGFPALVGLFEVLSDLETT
ncbi:MAG: MmgE/PrpD family protein [Gammaproteobacteria bacterium]